MFTIGILLFWSVLIGLWSKDRGGSFWLGFAVSLFATPLIGMIVVYVATKDKGIT